MKYIKVLVFVIVFVAVWIVAPAEAFVLGNAAPVAIGHSSVASAQHQTNLYFESEALSTPARSFNPYRQTMPRSFSGMPRYFSSSTKYFSGGKGAYGRASTYDGFTDFSADVSTTPTATPEPATLLLFGMGLAGAGIYRRMKK